MVYGKTSKEALYRTLLKRRLREKGIKGWKKTSRTETLEKLCLKL